MMSVSSFTQRVAAPALIAFSSLALLTACATPSEAGTLADVRVINRTTGQIAPTYHHQGRVYVAGNPGDRFAVQIVNRSPRRVLAVTSVDGVNVVSGETANPHQGGYVLAPGQSYDVMGWRKNVNEVAAFYFTTIADSYAARTDRPANIGVIGLAVFREYQPPRPRPLPQIAPRAENERFDMSEPRTTNQARSADAPAPAAGAAAGDATSTAEAARRPSQVAPAPMPSERIGTGHGERMRSDVTVVEFRRASSTPDEIITIHYDTHANLVARGVIPSPYHAPIYGDPQPFPGMRFAPDPRS